MSDINEILSKEAIEGVLKADRALTDLDATIVKVINNAQSMNSAIAGGGGMKSYQQAVKQLNNNVTQLNSTQQQSANVAKQLTAEQKKLADQAAKLAAKEKERNEALKLTVKSLADAERQNKALRETLKQLDLSTQSGRDSLKKYNEQVNKNTEFIRANVSAADQQRMNIGNYGAVWDKVKGFAMAAGGAVAGAMAAIKIGEGVIKSSQYATDEWNRSVAGLKNGWGEFMNAVSNMDFSNLIQRISEAAQAGRDYADVVDLMEKRQKGLSSQHKIENEQIAKLRLSYYDHNKTAKEKAAIMNEVIRLTQAQSEADNESARQNYEGFTSTIIAAKGIKKETLEQYLLFKGTTEDKVKLIERLKFVERAYKNNLAASGDEGALTKKYYREMIELRVAGVGEMSRIESKLSQKQIDQARALYDAVAETQTAIYANKEGFYRKEEMQLKKEEKAQEKALTGVELLAKKVKDLQEQLANSLKLGGETPQGLIRELLGSEAELKRVQEQIDDIMNGMQRVASKGYQTTKDAQGNSIIKDIAIGGANTSILTPRTATGSTAASGAAGTNQFMTNQEWGNVALENASTVSDSIFQIISNSDQAAFDHKMSLLDKEKEKKLKNANLTEKQKAKIEEDYSKKIAKLKEDQFRKEKAASIIQAIISTALAVIKAAPNPANMIAAGIAGAASIAVIAAQPVPEFDAGSDNTPHSFIAGERRPEWMITPSGGVQLVTKPTMFKNMAGATVIGGAETERLMKAGITPTNDIRPDIKRMEDNVVRAIKEKKELSIAASGSTITEREGDYFKTYFNKSVQWAGRRN